MAKPVGDFLRVGNRDKHSRRHRAGRAARPIGGVNVVPASRQLSTRACRRLLRHGASIAACRPVMYRRNVEMPIIINKRAKAAESGRLRAGV